METQFNIAVITCALLFVACVFMMFRILKLQEQNEYLKQQIKLTKQKIIELKRKYLY